MFKHILVPLDESALAECVLPHVQAMARVFGAKVTLLRVLEHANKLAGHSQPCDPFEWNLGKAEAEAYLSSIQSRFELPDSEVSTMLMEGDPAKNIIRFAHQNNVDLLILSSHGKSGLTGWTLGSVGQKLALHIHLSLMVVRAFAAKQTEQKEQAYQRIVLALDSSARAECALPIACRLARQHKAELMIVHFVEKPELPRRVPHSAEESGLVERLIELNKGDVERYFEDLTQQNLSDLLTTNIIVSDQLEDSLHAFVTEKAADLVVLAAHGLSSKPNRSFGSTVVNVLTYGTAPLLIVQDLKVHEVYLSAAEQAAKEFQGH